MISDSEDESGHSSGVQYQDESSLDEVMEREARLYKSKGGKAKKSKVQEEEEKEVCGICKQDSPPGDDDETVNWVDCQAGCKTWFHQQCLLYLVYL